MANQKYEPIKMLRLLEKGSCNNKADVALYEEAQKLGMNQLLIDSILSMDDKINLLTPKTKD
jgi:hypothetical protein